MDIKFNMNRTYTINGREREYRSLEEMPEGVRKIFQRAMESQSTSLSTETKIVFNGTEHESVAQMPADVRQLYEKVLKATHGGTAPSEADIAALAAATLNTPVKKSG